MIDFHGRTAIITGAGRGSGRVYAIEMAKLGAGVVVNDFSPSGADESSPANEVVKEIKRFGGRAITNHNNVATEEGGAEIIKAAMDELGECGHTHK